MPLAGIVPQKSDVPRSRCDRLKTVNPACQQSLPPAAVEAIVNVMTRPKSANQRITWDDSAHTRAVVNVQRGREDEAADANPEGTRGNAAAAGGVTRRVARLGELADSFCI
jgi:hypothetical protein